MSGFTRKTNDPMKKASSIWKRTISVPLTLIITLFSVAAQSNADGSMPQYLFPEFIKARILMKNGQLQEELMNFNTVTERMVYLKSSKYYDLVNPDMVDTVYFGNIRFITIGKYFYELLYKGSVTLLLQHKGSLFSAGAEVGYGGKSQLAATDYLSSVDLASGRFNLPIPADFVVQPSPVYWIKRKEELIDFTTEKQFLKVWPDKNGQIKEFIKENRLKTDKPEDMARIIEFACNMQ
jgi:hypothetical protein